MGVDETPLASQDSYELRYEQLIVPLVKVVQFQQQEVDTLKSKLQ